jgi:NADP-reducing hydrogenase subunit HndD
MIHITINGKPVEAPDGCTIMEAAESAGVKIPSLCHLKNVHTYGSCRMCVVEVEGAKNLQASCIVKARDGMIVHTASPRVRAARKVLYELLLSNHPKDCLSCTRNQNCELQTLGYELGVTDSRFEGAMNKTSVDVSPSITRDMSKCVLCRRCVTACNSIQHVGAINAQNRGFRTVISPAMNLPLSSTACAMCGQCTVVCPTGALTETDGITPVWKALADPNKRVVVQVAPAVRAALGEEFGLPVGTPVTGKIAAALHAMNFDDVFDTDFSADLTIVEEGTELLGRLNKRAQGRGRGAADDNELLARLDKAHRARVPHRARPPVELQEPAYDDGRGDKILLCEKDRHRPARYVRGVRHALHGEKIRDTASGDGSRRRARRRRGHNDA